jgi:hypothetical protein
LRRSKKRNFLETDALYLENGEVKCRTKADFAVPLKEILISGILKEDGTYRGGPIIRTRNVYAEIHVGLGRSGNQPGRASERAL